MSTSPSEIAALKTKLKATWMAGDFGLIAKGYETGAADFVHRLKLVPGTKVLDVACGTGNLTIPAAQTGASVTGVDIATNLLAQAQDRAQTSNVTVTFEEGDAEQLPYSDSSFDTVMTMYGAMFAPRPDLVASEMLRVCRPGGTIAMANWTPTGFVGQMFKIISSHVPPPNMPSPIKWGEEETVRERFGNRAEVKFTKHVISLTFPFEPKEVVEFWRDYYGPTQKAFGALQGNTEKQVSLRKALEQLWTEHNQHMDGTTRVESEYLEVHATPFT